MLVIYIMTVLAVVFWGCWDFKKTRMAQEKWYNENPGQFIDG